MLPKNERKYIYLLAAAFLALFVVEYFKPQPIDWSQSFSKGDKIPFGSAALYELLPDLFPRQEVLSNQQTFFELDGQASLQNYKSIILLNNNVNFDDTDWEVLENWVAEGGHLFIATTGTDKPWAKQLGISLEGCYNLWAGDDAKGSRADSTYFNLTNAKIKAVPAYAAPLGLCQCHISQTINMPTEALESEVFEAGVVKPIIGEEITVLGRHEDSKQPNFVAIKVGSGMIYVHANPLLFTNYYVTQPNGASYLEKALSYLPKNGPVIWDEYYKIGREGSPTLLRVILSKASLRGAWYLALFTMFLFILANIKRQQRPIPVVVPPQNSTVEFVETIGRLYFQNGDHQDLANKMTLFFKDHIRRKYFIKLSGDWTKEDAEKLALKSGAPLNKVSALFANFARLQRLKEVQEADLLQLRTALTEFQSLSV